MNEGEGFMHRSDTVEMLCFHPDCSQEANIILSEAQPRGWSGGRTIKKMSVIMVVTRRKPF